MIKQEKQREYRDADWLHDATWRREVYRKPTPTWTHEHCVFCSRRVAEPGCGDPDALPEAWTTAAGREGDTGYGWVCPSCFAQLRDTFRWRVAEPCSGPSQHPAVEGRPGAADQTGRVS